MKIIYLSILMLLFGIQSSAQTVERLLNYTQYTSEWEPPRKYISGTIYLNEKFIEGKIFNTDTNEFQSAFLRYNALEDLIEIKLHRNSEVKVLPKVKNLKYQFDDYSLVYKEIKTSFGDKSEGYFIEYFSKDNLVFIAKPVLTAKKDKLSLYDNTVELFLDYQFFIEKDNSFNMISLWKNKLQKHFSDKVKMKTYFDKNNIKNEQDIVAMLEFYTE